jgi:hypothetical protein
VSIKILELVKAIKTRSKHPYRFVGTSLYYVPTPKNACTSIKNALYQYNYKKPCEKFYFLGKRIDAHEYYPSKMNASLNWTQSKNVFGITRDPFKRFISVYCNRVLHHKDLKPFETKIENSGLAATPSIIEFVENLETYQSICPTILHHTAPQVSFLGVNPEAYWQLYDISELTNLKVDVKKEFGIDLTLEHMQTGGGEYKNEALDSLTPQLISKIKDYYELDYKAFGRYR